MKDYKNLEREAHVSIDDIINKVTQEIWELIEACVDWDTEEMYKESWDVLVNIFSVAEDVWLDISSFDNIERQGYTNSIQLSILNSRWNDRVQGLRSRYSRKNISIAEVSDVTQEFIEVVLSYSDPEKNISEILQTNLEKFSGRTWEYLWDIDIKDYISDVPDFPKKWIDFKDISPLLESSEAFRFVCMEMVKQCEWADVITGLDSRGFLFWTMVAEELGVPFVMIRKKWKLPWKTIEKSYGLEYGTDVIEMQEWAIKGGQKVAVIDDLLATWWTMNAATSLIEQAGGSINNISFVISLDEKELSDMPNRKKLEKYRVESLVSYE